METQLATPRVLLVEDEGLIRLVTAECLRDEGFDVVEAWNGDEAIKLLDGGDSFDALFTDVRMPGAHDGVDVAIYARSRDPFISVLVASGHAGHLPSRLSGLQPAAVFIGKPYGREEVVATLRSLIGKS